MLLAFFLSHSASPHTVGQWRLPRSFQGLRYDRPTYWEHVARTAERGGIDTIFLSDSYSIYETYRGDSDDTLRWAVQCPRHDPLPLIPIMARVTQSIGIITTLSTAFLPPYWVARQFATLDHLTEGRVGWNLVTTAGEPEARQFGQKLDEHDTRYRRAEGISSCARRYGIAGSRTRSSRTARRACSPIHRKSRRSIFTATSSRARGASRCRARRRAGR